MSTDKPYFSGEVISYNNKIIFGTVNSDNFELFTLEGDKIGRQAMISSDEKKYKQFFDLIFKKEDSHLYAYLVNGKYLYKYDISDPKFPTLIKKIKDNAEDWMYGLSKSGDKVATIGEKGIKIWNTDLQIILSYNLKSDLQDNISLSDDGRFIFYINNNSLQVIDIYTDEILSETKLSLNEKSYHRIYNDIISGYIYLVDDEAARKISYIGGYDKLNEVGRFTHISDQGYDVAGLDKNGYIYFSDGLGVVKADKNTMKPIDWAYTAGLGEINGWAMGMSVVDYPNGEKIILFNKNSILILDEDLNMVDYYVYSESGNVEEENLWLQLDKYRGFSGFDILLKGGGYGYGEDLIINFAGIEFSAKADRDGRFREIIKVPSVLPGRTYIEVTGKYSGLHYSVSFDIE